MAKNQSTSLFGNIVSLDESPKTEHLLYVGTDDGLVQVTEDGGATWRKEQTFPGVPDMTYVSDLFASTHDANVVYAAFNNHKMGDFKPYLLRSADKGRTWTSIAGRPAGARQHVDVHGGPGRTRTCGSSARSSACSSARTAARSGCS